MDTTAKQPVSNTFKGKIKHIVDAPPYQIVTIALDPASTPEITVAYIPVPGGPKLAAGPAPTAPQPVAATASGTTGAGSGTTSSGSGTGSSDGKVTVTIPVPNAVISVGN
jgi:hypothetical protein